MMFEWMDGKGLAERGGGYGAGSRRTAQGLGGN